MNRKAALLVAVLLALPITAQGGAPSAMLSLSSPPLSPTDMVALGAQISALEAILADPTLGCQRELGEAGWNSAAFAAYSGGVLTDLGYTVRVATASGWSDGTHSWLLVRLSVPSAAEVWAPIEASPALGVTQNRLGAVAVTSASLQEISFSPEYGAFDHVSELSANRIPTAHITARSLSLPIEAVTTLTALGSYDPDGELVLYRWRFGDGAWIAQRSWSTTVTPTEPGTMVITLQVIDNAGGCASFSLQVRAIDPTVRDMDNPTGGCGCGG